MNTHESVDYEALNLYPSLRLVRDVVDLPEDFDARLGAEVDELGFPDKTDIYLLDSESCVSLISPTEILNFHRLVDREPSENAMTELADYLETELPSGLDEPMPIKIKPINRFFHRLPADPRSASDHVDHCDFVSTFNKPLRTERQLAKDALYKFFEVNPKATDGTKIWEKYDWKKYETTRLVVASATGRQNIQRITRLILESDILPAELTLGPATIEEV